jgi:hypothetical protein
MKLLGLGGIRRGSGGTGAAFHDIDEVISSPLAQWKRPWWVKLVNNPTVEIDWDRMQRFDGRKMMQVPFVEYVGKDRNSYLRDHRNKKTRQWILERKSGYTLVDRALDLAGRTGTVDPTFLGACALALFTSTVQHFFASFAESEPRAAWIGALLMGVPPFILAGLTFWLILIT